MRLSCIDFSKRCSALLLVLFVVLPAGYLHSDTLIQSIAYPNNYVVPLRDVLALDNIRSDMDAQHSAFARKPGLSRLAGELGVSLESRARPGNYLRHRNFAILLEPNDNSVQFAEDATFVAIDGLFGQGFSLRSVNYPSMYVHVVPGQGLRLTEYRQIITARSEARASFFWEPIQPAPIVVPPASQPFQHPDFRTYEFSSRLVFARGPVGKHRYTGFVEIGICYRGEIISSRVIFETSGAPMDFWAAREGDYTGDVMYKVELSAEQYSRGRVIAWGELNSFGKSTFEAYFGPNPNGNLCRGAVLISQTTGNTLFLSDKSPFEFMVLWQIMPERAE